MKSLTLLALLAVLTFCSTGIKAAKLPATFKLCKKKDPNLNECLRIAIQDAVRELKPGLPALHLLPIDPLEVTKIVIEDGAGRPVRLNLEFNNAKISGFTKGEITAIRADLEKGIVEADVFIPDSSAVGDYVMDGRFLVLPVKGKGKCQIEFTGANATLKIVAEKQTKNGKVHWNVVKFEVNIKSMDTFKVHFDDLFNGDEALSENTNKVLNDNWQQLWEELRPSFEQTFSAVFLQFANEVFSRVPEEDIFLD